MLTKESLQQAYTNPVIPGFFPDPSVIRVEDDYYLVTSSFEYFPGVPIFHSKNLVDWEQIGHVLTRKEQVDLSGRRYSHGIYAPTLRYYDGVFYMVTTDVYGIGNFYVTASDPAGPWSNPIRLPYGGIDPSLMFDDDGRVFVTVQQGSGKESHIIQYEIDSDTGEALNEPVRIWDGDGGVWTEAPHLYKINGMYYIMSACGGTSYDHRVIIGRSSEPYGPFEPCPYPILTHNELPNDPFQCLGHADLVEDSNGNWWAVFLGTRPLRGEVRYSVLGRETFLAPVTWNEDGWPMIDNNEGIVREKMPANLLPGADTEKPRVEVAGEAGVEPLSSRLGNHGEAEVMEGMKEGAHSFPPQWSFLRTFDDERYQLGSSPDSFILKGNASSLEDDGPATFACLRQTAYRMRFSCALQFRPKEDGEEAGIAARLNNRAYIILSLKRVGGEQYVHLSVRNGDEQLEHLVPWNKGLAHLAIESDEGAYYCFCSADGAQWEAVPLEIKAEWLSPEKNGGFTGVCIGLYASSNGSGFTASAVFQHVQYQVV